MKFSRFVAIIAVISMAASAYAEEDGGRLRRNVDVAESDMNDSLNSNGVVILNTNTNSNNSSAEAESTAKQGQKTTVEAEAIAQPTTIVEASPVVESKAEILRKQRIDAEINTEQKIVEKLEDSRLQEERARAERLFGNKFESNQTIVVEEQKQHHTPPVVIIEEEKHKIDRPTQVTIEKVEIIHPETDKSEVVIETRHKPHHHEEEKPVEKNRFFVAGQFGNLSYDASNMKSNYGLGVSAGTIVDNRWALELGYFYSEHSVDTWWVFPLYSKLDQHDLSASAKYYVLPGKLKPYIGGSATYISRTYNERSKYEEYWYRNQNEDESTSAVNLGVLGGVDFFITDNFSIGGGLEYSFNVMNNNPVDWGNDYGLPEDAKDLEEINFYVFKLGVKYAF